MRDADAGLVRDLSRMLSPDRVLARPIDRLGRSADASIYRLIPQAVVRPRDLAELGALFAYVRSRGRRLTFRAAGTSLSGQAVTDDLLVELRPFWRACRVLDAGRRVWSQPGVVGGHLNRLLAPLGHRIGPDPASIDTAMLGGILANNSSGMCCGVAQNSYHTLDSLCVLLADGTLVDTARPDADAALRRERPGLHADLLRLRDGLRADAALAERIRRKFAGKNTTGYSLNAFLDFDAPAEILAHLMVGSEGTLGFIAEATLRTVPEPPARATALVLFDELAEAGAAVAPLAEAGAATLEILDSACLRVLASELGVASDRRAAALLAELRAPDEAALEQAVARAEAALRPSRLLEPARFTRDAAERERLWRLRKGLAASTGAMRPSGTAFLTEDVAVPVERLAEAIADFEEMFARHGASDTIVFGHAKDGNLHFVWSEDLRDPAAVVRYGRFLEGLVEIVTGKYDGAIKAEHGSGRNMAPFVRSEWGDAAYAVMQRVKRLLDPDNILNPGVVLNDDPQVHLRHLKPMPTIAPLADRCIECGFCEPRCPSQDLTLTPRQRIMVTRELARLAAAPVAADLGLVLRAEFAYDGLATCVGDSMCETSCPVGIDVGALIKELKAAARPAWARGVALLAARRFGATSRLARLGLRLGALLPGLVPGGPLPRPAPALPRPPPAAGGSGVVYFPSCLTRTLGPLPGESQRALAEVMLEVLAAAGFAARYPDGVERLCCGLAFSSKGFPAAAERAARDAAEALWAASREGRDPVVADASPCAGSLAERAVAQLATSGRALRVLDFPAFWAREALPRVGATPRLRGTVVLHPTCTLVRAGGLPDLRRVAEAHAEAAMIPTSAECCGFAGDRGFLLPELTASATAREAAEVRSLPEAAGFYSTCRTCEIGMSRATGRRYRSLVHLVHEALLRA